MSFTQVIEEKVMPVASKISGQRHLRAIRTGIVATLPITIVGSFFTILLNIPNENYMNFIAPFRAKLDLPFRYTVGIFALYVAYSIASSLATHYKLDASTCGLLATMAFFVSTVVPTQVKEAVPDVIGTGRWINLGSLSSASLFGAIATSLLTVEIYKLMKDRNIVIKMPPGVPPEVSNSFVALLPAAVILTVFWAIRHVLNFDISSFLSMLLMPFKDFFAGNSLLGGLSTVLLITIFWVLGIHGPAIMGPVIRPFWESSIAENITAFEATKSAYDLPNLFTEQFLQWFVWIGGAGGTLALVILFMFSKSKYLRSLGRLGFLPGLFNINEPIIFGAPIVMNPILAIPFILAPLVTTLLSYVLTVTKVVPMMMARLTFTLPAPMAAIMSTNWSIMAGVLVVINFIIMLAIYYPFFKIFEKQELAKEAKEELED